MPLSKIQSEILRLLASNRNPESYVAGSTRLNREAPRCSDNIDIFHDREEHVHEAAKQDAAVLEANGYSIRWHRREPLIYTAFADRSGESTKLEWAADSDFRFFPTIPDEEFGSILHPADLATNRVAAAFGRREPRDVVDLLTVHERILPLDSAIWATVGKSIGFTPEGVVNWIR
jgi:hypothetical protein